MREYYKIDKGIEIPESDRHINKKYYPWKDMNVGDSFLISNIRGSHYSSLVAAASHYGKQHKTKYLTRIVGNDLRVWRIK